ncbi:hypothetical protein EV363DRAFT_1320035, partial [Boletus edulis]
DVLWCNSCPSSLKSQRRKIDFCRSPQWFVPRGQYRYPEWIKWAFAWMLMIRYLKDTARATTVDRMIPDYHMFERL